MWEWLPLEVLVELLPRPLRIGCWVMIGLFLLAIVIASFTSR